jgi:hypothetical protein
MERPNKKDYDFNDLFEGLMFGREMNKYADYLESLIIKGQTLPIDFAPWESPTSLKQSVEEVKINPWETGPKFWKQEKTDSDGK